MAVVVTHNTPADGTFSASGSAAWDEDHAVAGLGTMAEQAAADYTTTAGLTAYLASPPAIGGTAAAAVTGTTVTATGAIVPKLGTTSAVAIMPTGGDGNDGIYFPSISTMAWVQNGTERVRFIDSGLSILSGFLAIGPAADTNIARVAANSLQFGAGSSGNGAGATTSRTEINKTVTGITDAAATATFTVTIPNAAHTATIEFELTGIIGAGGAIGAHEAAATTSGKIIVTRTAGVNAVASAVSTAFGAVAANVAGATTVTVAAAVSAISGAVGAANTFTINVTITKAGGSSANHICLCYAKVMNANASGVTIA
jgi:hypothetical protein